MGITECEKLQETYIKLFESHRLLKEKHLLLEREYKALVEECSKKLRYKDTKITKLRNDYNNLMADMGNKGWNEL